MADPLISVALITYNQEQYIAQAIESILMQEGPFNYELVIGEDCSTDNTRAIVMDYQRRYPGVIRVISSDENMGMMPNLTRTIKACKGKYIAFCEGDDYWLSPYKLEKQLNFMMENPSLSLSFHAVRAKSESNNIDKIRMNYNGERIFSKKDVILKGGSLFNMSSVMIRHGIIDDWIEWYAGCPITDVPLALIAIDKGVIGYLDQVLSVYRLSARNSWTRKMSEVNIDTMFSYLMSTIKMRDEYDYLTNHKYAKWLKQRNSFNVRYFLFYYAKKQHQQLTFFRKLKSEMSMKDSVLSKLSIIFFIGRIRTKLGRLYRYLSKS
jgi:glycosyltransferase involved in cell wall biosynthesis